MASPVGKELLNYAEREIAKQNSSIKTQAGQAGAVPPQDTAPLTGAPHEADGTIINPPGMTQDAPFHWSNNQTMADVASEQMREGQGTNGTSYSNH